jgi:hypothetical protein
MIIRKDWEIKTVSRIYPGKFRGVAMPQSFPGQVRLAAVAQALVAYGAA